MSFTIRVEEVDLKEWVRAAHVVGMTISEWARRGLNAYAAGDGKNLRGIRPDDLARRSTPAPGPPAVDTDRSVPPPAGDPAGPAQPEPASVAPEPAFAKPEHPADCQCGVCDFAREAGLKPPLPPK